MSNVKENIEKLKVIVLDLYRSAANLDNVIQDIELIEGDVSENELTCYLRAKHDYREDFKKYKFGIDLDKREEEIWNELIT